MDYRVKCVLDDNQKYNLVRRALIYFFSRNHKEISSFGYQIEDFQPSMQFVKECYESKVKLKEISQNVKISNDPRI